MSKERCFYHIEAVGNGYVDFIVSNNSQGPVVERTADTLAVRKLKGLIEKYYGPMEQDTVRRWDDEISGPNSVAVKSALAARRLASELVWIFQEAGYKPMELEYNKAGIVSQKLKSPLVPRAPRSVKYGLQL